MTGGLPLRLTNAPDISAEKRKEDETKIASSGKYLRVYANIKISGVPITGDIYFGCISRIPLLYANPSIYPG